MRAQLAAAKQREAELAMQLKQHQEGVPEEARDTRVQDFTHGNTGVVKSEDADDGSSTSTAREDSPFGSPVSFVSGAGAGAAGFRNLVANPKSGASLGLMVSFGFTPLDNRRVFFNFVEIGFTLRTTLAFV